MNKVEYEWANYAHHRGIDAQVAGAALEQIQAKHGGSPVAVVRVAQRKTHPLHPAFDWDDREAAEQWRVQQARSLVNHLLIKRVDKEATPPVRAFVSVYTEDGDREYVASTDAREDPILREQIRKGLLSKLATVRGQLAGWQEFSKAAALIDEAQQQLKEAA